MKIIKKLVVVYVTFLIANIQSAVHKVDITVRQRNDQYVDLKVAKETEIWGFLLYDGEGNTVKFNIGRISDTGTGEVGDAPEPPEGELLDDSGFPSGSRVQYPDSSAGEKRITVIQEGSVSSKVNHIGAFFVEAVNDNNMEKIIAIYTAQTANIKPEDLAYTKSASIGDSITLSVVSSIENPEKLQWRHNGGSFIESWSGQTSVKIDNVRKADEGIYECHEDGKRGEGVHAIMRLIVRACPTRFYGINDECNQSCQTCYNDGMCEEETGVCVCRPGFKGDDCREACGNNHFGANCDIKCSKNNKCKTNYFCVPDPVGCSCHTGYHGDTCGASCLSGYYGADCKLTCHCASDCDRSKGCTGECMEGYGGPQCQEPETCQDGYFGDVCQYMCHCKDDVPCSKDTGTCNNGECAAGWGGINDCQQALPGLFNEPTIAVNDHEASIAVSWDGWLMDIDYGTGPVEFYRVHYGKTNFTQYKQTSQITALIENLARGPIYVIAIGVLRTIDSSLVEGKLGPIVTTRVLCIEPTSAPNITSVLMTTDTAELTWVVPQGDDWIGCETGIVNFTISYNNLKLTVPGNARSASVTGLTPCTVYSFKISASNADKSGPKSSVIEGTTDTVAPSQVKSLMVTSASESSLHVSWGKADIQDPCVVSGYTVTYKLINLDQCELKDGTFQSNSTDSTEITVYGLEEYSTYGVSVYAQSGNVPGQRVNNTAITEESVPTGVPTNLEKDASARQIITFIWQQPQCGYRNGEIVVYDFMFGKNIEDNDAILGSTQYPTHIFEGLDHYTEYAFQVRANTSSGAGPFTDVVRVRTAESNPDESPINIVGNNTIKAQLEFRWEPPPIESQNGIIILYEFEFGKANDSKSAGSTPSPHVKFEGLMHNMLYNFRVRANTAVGAGPYSESLRIQTLPSGKSSSAVVAASTSVAVFVILLAILLTVAILKRRRRNVKGNKSSNLEPTNAKNNDYVSSMQSVANSARVNVAADVNDTNAFGETATDENFDKSKPRALIKPTIIDRKQPVKVEDFLEYVKSKKIDAPDHELIFDFKALSDKQQSPWNVAKKGENTKKNRYINIITYDHSRVLLEPLKDDPHSDYINASYIDGYRQPNAYIASQGPNTETVKDMWRMIWQEKTCTIIMATKITEGVKKKCEKYWPNKGKTVTYGNIIVNNHGEEEHECYTIRTFIITKDSEDGEKRELKQFHFTGWPDMQAPEFAAPVLQFLDRVNGSNPSNAGPIVVHCSAGVGRTGTFIAIDVMLKMAKAEGKVDIFNFVTEMRTRRTHMIQTETQYEFVHDALVEALFCGKTTMRAEEVETIWSKLKQDNTLVAGQHGALDAIFPPISKERCTGGRRAENLKKNRYHDKIPPDSARPYLMSIDGNDGNNYINAAFCNGYARDNMYLTTQIPLPNTVGDFWCMIYDYECHTIVTLNDPMKMDKTCGYYWPDDGSITCGVFTIDSNGVEQGNHAIERKLKYFRTNKQEDARTVTLIQYTDWPMKLGTPKSAESFLQLLDCVERNRRDSGDQRMAVVCMDGVTRCGLLCAVMSIIDKIKEEQLVDVFQAVKRLRVSRYEMVPSLDQYKFCYEMARVYLQAFETYSNFAS